MRVISGSARGTRLLDLGDTEIRPTLDRVKESLFNQVGSNLEGISFLDLFAGTGSIGIEALSRGAEQVVFVGNVGLEFCTSLGEVTRPAKCHTFAVSNSVASCTFG